MKIFRVRLGCVPSISHAVGRGPSEWTWAVPHGQLREDACLHHRLPCLYQGFLCQGQWSRQWTNSNALVEAIAYKGLCKPRIWCEVIYFLGCSCGSDSPGSWGAGGWVPEGGETTPTSGQAGKVRSPIIIIITITLQASLYVHIHHSLTLTVVILCRRLGLSEQYRW